MKLPPPHLFDAAEGVFQVLRVGPLRIEVLIIRILG